MNRTDQQSRAQPRRSDPRRDYSRAGRAAVREFLSRLAGDPAPESACAMLAAKLVSPKIVRLWVLDDLFDEPQLERVARLAYPELRGAFAALDEARDEARVRHSIDLVGPAVEAAMQGLQWPDSDR